MSSTQHSIKNLLLRALSPEAFETLEPHLQRVSLELRHPIEAPGQPPEHVYFYETAIASNIARSGQEEVEAGIVGRDGMSGTTLVQRSETSGLESFIQHPGEAFRIEAGNLQQAMRDSDELTTLLLRFCHAHIIQMAHTALANARFTILERMARWLLMCHDRVYGNDMGITHEFLAIMLGVRRAGVTTEMHVLEGEHAVLNRRGRVMVRDRARLEELANGSYGAPEAEYERLIGQTLRRKPEPV